MLDRRTFLALLGGAAALQPSHAATGQVDARVTLGDPEPFSRALLEDEARALAARAYEARPSIPKAWTEMTYDQYRTYWFRSSDALWSDTDVPLRVDLLHPGLYYHRPVRLDVAEGAFARKILFDMDLFDRTDMAPELPVDDTLGYSGIRLRAEVNNPDIFQEFMVFQGASYFRAIGRNLTYGLSARGLAIGTGSPQGEEFPDFVRLILERPEAGASRFKVHGLLDSPSVAGVYSFDISADDATEVDVEAILFPREPMNNVGLAPLTSMFFFDQTNRHRFDDYRPAVHDNDGLSIINGNGEKLWRPLANPKTLQISAFVDNGPRGFGLLQRSRKFSDFADLEALYHNRPGLWIEPKEDWGRGSVTLVEIPTDKEIYDNIVAYWRPREDLQPGTEARFGYRMTWSDQPHPPMDVPHVTQTRVGSSGFGSQVVTIDYSPDATLPDDLGVLEAKVALSNGSLKAAKIQRNPETGGVRLAFTFDPEDAQLIEMRAQIEQESVRKSEVWLYRWTA